MNRNGAIPVLISILFALWLLFPLLPVTADPTTTVTTSIDQADQTVDVSPGSTGQVQFTGECEAQTFSPSSIVVSLSATVTLGNATVSPTSFVLTSSSSVMPLSISARIPIGTSSSESVTLTLSGTWEQGVTQGVVGGSQAAIVVEQYFQMNVQSDTPYKEANPGDDVGFDVVASNLGNGQDTITTSVTNESELVAGGFTIPPIPKEVVDEGASKTIDIDLHVGEDTDFGVYQIDLRFTSENSDGNYHESYSLYLRVISGTVIEEPGNVTVLTEFDSPSFQLDVSPGSSGSMLLNVTVSAYPPPDVPVDYTIIAGSTIGSAVSLPQANLPPLTHDEPSQVIHVDVRIPPASNEWLRPSVTVGGTWTQGADSGDIHGDQALIIIGQYYGCTLDVLPVLEVNRDGETDATFSIQNTGNGNDTYSLTIANLDDLADAGLTVGLSRSGLDLGVSAEGNVTLTISAHTIALLGDHALSIVVDFGENGTKAHNITLVVHESTDQPSGLEGLLQPPYLACGISLSVIAIVIFLVILLRRKRPIPE